MADQGHDIPISERLALNREQAALLLSVPEDTLLNLHRVGSLRAIKIGKHLRWTRADLQAFVEKLRTDESGGGNGE